VKNFIDRNVARIVIMVAMAVVEITQAVLDTQTKGRKKK
jgi:hypothetical protein